MFALLIRILGNSLALYAAYLTVTGFSFSGGVKEYIFAGALLGLLNMVVKPILKLISFPVIILTLGLFMIVINALLLWLVDYIFDFMTIVDIYGLVWATIVISIVNMIIGVFTKNSN